MTSILQPVRHRVAYLQYMTSIHPRGTPAHNTLLEEAEEAIINAIRYCRSISPETATETKRVLDEWMTPEQVARVMMAVAPKVMLYHVDSSKQEHYFWDCYLTQPLQDMFEDPNVPVGRKLLDMGGHMISLRCTKGDEKTYALAVATACQTETL